MKSNSGVYSITNIVTNRVYIGSSIDIEDRFLQHKRRLKSNSHPNPKLQNSYNKYGLESFIFDIIEIVEDFELLIEREQFYLNKILFADSKDTKIFEEKSYNILRTAGNLCGFKHREESKIKMSNTKSKLSSGKKIPTDLEIFDKIYLIDEEGVTDSNVDETNGFYGKKHKMESKTLMSIHKRGEKNIFYGVGPMAGKKHSIEAKKKISVSNSGKNNKNSKPIFQISLDGQFIREYSSSGEASKMTGISQGNINLCCNGIRRTASGYIWKFKSEFSDLISHGLIKNFNSG